MPTIYSKLLNAITVYSKSINMILSYVSSPIENMLSFISKPFLGFHCLLFLFSLFKYGCKRTLFAWIYLIYMILCHGFPFILAYCLYKIYKNNEYPYNIIYILIFLYIGYVVNNPFECFQKYILKLLSYWDRNNGFFSVNYFNTIPSKDELCKSSIMLAPHGPTVIPFPLVCESIYKETNIISKGVVHKSINKIPFMNWMSSLIGSVIPATPEDINKVFGSNENTPVLIYPGGTKDVLVNSEYQSKYLTVNLKGLSRLFDYHLKNKRKIIPALCLNENDIFFHPKFLIKIFTFINKFASIGIPLPYWTKLGLLFMSEKSLNIVFGLPIIPTVSDDNESLKIKYIYALKELMIKAIANNWTNRTLNIITKKL
jgi:hypothetical protein